jgi:hypothetical protein
MKKKYKEIHRRIINCCGFDIADIENIKDDQDFITKVKNHIDWFDKWALETKQRMELILRENFTFDEIWENYENSKHKE